MQTALELEFADGRYLFDLKLPQIIELQEKCGHADQAGVRHRKGILSIYSNIMSGRAFLGEDQIGVPDQAEASTQEIYEIIRLGLIGGGEGVVNEQPVKVSALDAKTLVDNYALALPISAAWDMAASIIHARVVGFQSKKKAPENEQSPTQTDSATRQ